MASVAPVHEETKTELNERLGSLLPRLTQAGMKEFDLVEIIRVHKGVLARNIGVDLHLQGVVAALRACIERDPKPEDPDWVSYKENPIVIEAYKILSDLSRAYQS